MAIKFTTFGGGNVAPWLLNKPQAGLSSDTDSTAQNSNLQPNAGTSQFQAGQDPKFIEIGTHQAGENVDIPKGEGSERYAEVHFTKGRFPWSEPKMELEFQGDAVKIQKQGLLHRLFSPKHQVRLDDTLILSGQKYILTKDRFAEQRLLGLPGHWDLPAENQASNKITIGATDDCDIKISGFKGDPIDVDYASLKKTEGFWDKRLPVIGALTYGGMTRFLSYSAFIGTYVSFGSLPILLYAPLLVLPDILRLHSNKFRYPKLKGVEALKGFKAEPSLKDRKELTTPLYANDQRDVSLWTATIDKNGKEIYAAGIGRLDEFDGELVAKLVVERPFYRRVGAPLVNLLTGLLRLPFKRTQGKALADEINSERGE